MGGKHFRAPTFTCTGEVRGGLEHAGRPTQSSAAGAGSERREEARDNEGQ